MRFNNIIFHADNVKVLQELPDNIVDSVVTDPPYGIKFMNKKWDYEVPPVRLWQEVLRVLKPGGHAVVACGTRTQHRMAVNLEDAGFEIRDLIAWVYGSGFPKNRNIGKAVEKLQKTEQATVDTSSQWAGWGTALKPAMELWTLCRKPLSEPSTVKNVLKWGTGAINIDKSRIPTNELLRSGFAKTNRTKGVNSTSIMMHTDYREKDWEPNDAGRYPANLIHDNSTIVRSCFRRTPPSKDTARYFKRVMYQPKVNKKERNAGCENLPTQQTTGGGGLVAQYRDDGSLETSSLGGKYGSIKAVSQNHHPTIKPIALMEYLCNMITPPGGLILDPYLGSGTTMIAATTNGFSCYGIEVNAEYVTIADSRVKYYLTDQNQYPIIQSRFSNL